MRAFTFSICLLFFHIGLAAQTDAIVIRVSGQAFYQPSFGAKQIAMYPGLQLNLRGKVRCKGSGSAKLLYNNSTIVVSGTKLREVQEVVRTNTSGSQMGFTGRFFSFVTESVKESDSDEQLKKHHRRYMSKSSGGIKGWAKEEYSISTLLLTTGKLPSANVIFKWRNTDGEGPYTFRLLSLHGNTIAQLLIRDTSITLDLDQLALNLEEEYEWEVTRGEKAKSVAMPFEVCPINFLGKEADLSQEKAYQAADPAERQLMLAFSLEEDRCYYSANNIYGQLLSADPNNVLLRKLYATFLARMDMLPEAQAMLRE